MARTIFFSWQSDLDNKYHRNFIEKCINKALKNLEKDNDAKVYMDYDRDTLGLMGSPDISFSIFDKIEKSVLFVCDISIINSNESKRKMPNPNVLIELGYAIKQLGWDNIICLFNSNTGKIEDLPFDLRQKRITQYNPLAENETKRLTSILEVNIKNLFVEGKLFNPLNDYMKGRIDKAFLDICKQLSNVLFETTSLSEGLSNTKDMLELKYDDIINRLKITEFPAFLVLNTYQQTNIELREILKELFSSAYFQKDWSYSVLELIDWIREYEYFVSKRNAQFAFEKIVNKKEDNYAVVSATAINPSNPVHSLLILETYNKDGVKYVDTIGGRVINTTQYPCEEPTKELTQYFRVKPAAIKITANKLFRLITLCKKWLEITDSESILNPDFYTII